MREIIIGQIIKDGKIAGTGFLITQNLVMTAKHNVIDADEVNEERFEEKDVVFRIESNDDIAGKTINLSIAIQERIDCVLIRLNETISRDEMYDLVDVENDIIGYECQIIGFPKIHSKKTVIKANINSHEDTLIISIKEENQLRNYEGLSGSPIIILGNVVGIVIKQESSERIIALSIKQIVQCFDGIPNIKKKIPKISEEKFNLQDIKQKVQQIISMAGPRYCKERNIKTKTYKDLDLLLSKNKFEDQLQSVIFKIKDCIMQLKKFIEYNPNKSQRESSINEIINTLESDCAILESKSYEKKNLKQIQTHLNEFKRKIFEIFNIEKQLFEEKYGNGTYDNESWKGYMATYMCSFPTHYLDELKVVFYSIPSILNMLNINLICNEKTQSILIIGRGGIGKTHLLCDIVCDFLEKDIPAILMLGEMFNEKGNADTVIMDWYQREETIENFFSWLNEYGDQNNTYIPICIDAINETDNNSYWNLNLPLILSKAEKYPTIKIIISCRTLYLKESLNEEKISKMIQMTHDGFNEMEEEAVSKFCEYYGVNINYDSINTPEFINPLYLRMLCEIAKEKDNKTVAVEDIQVLMDNFFEKKNKEISSEFSDYFSVNDRVIMLALNNITQYMSNHDQSYISWEKLREIIFEILRKYKIENKTSKFIKKLISENLLKEADNKGETYSFAYQKYYEYLYAQKYLDKSVDEIIEAVECEKISLGTLEIIQILYFRKNNIEFLSQIDYRIHVEAIESFMSGLYWRKENEITQKTVDEIEKLLFSSNKEDKRVAIFGLLAVSTKDKCAVNAKYIHKILAKVDPIKRDCVLSIYLLKEYDKEKIISELCERAITLNNHTIPASRILLLTIILCWGTGSNDIKLRDKASKGLVNLFKLYPSDMLTIIDMFKNVDDDYIQERIWQAIYSSLVIRAEEKYVMSILDYIKNDIISAKHWPQNVLLRDYLRNIFEFAYYKGWCSKNDLELARPPYASQKHVLDESIVRKFENIFPTLYWNCQGSDFAIYTIPSKVMDYGITKKYVGLLIFEDIVKSGYETCTNLDMFIDYKYGSLRHRDEQVERIGKKYQKIFLYREMGNIYDNYNYSPKFRLNDVNNECPAQGYSFRSIDLTLPQNNKFEGNSFTYLFYRFNDWSDKRWFKKNDIEHYLTNLIGYTINGEEYYMLQGYLNSKETQKKEYREVWMQIRTYLYSKNKKIDLLNWFNNKNFEGRWMPEGIDALYTCCVGEYPWGPSIKDYVEYDKMDFMEGKQDFGQETPAPCYIIPTVNTFSTEKDSLFCLEENYSFMFPSFFLMNKMDLSWNGSFGYNSNGHIVIINGRHDSIYISKKFLIEFLTQNELDIVWTVLGEKRKVRMLGNNQFPGKSEFSFTYFLNEKNELCNNHKLYDAILE